MAKIFRWLAVMTPYRGREHNSGVAAFEAGNDFIRVRFKTGAEYLYTDDATGHAHVAEMKRRAARGSGLSTYISQVVKAHFAARDT